MSISGILITYNPQKVLFIIEFPRQLSFAAFQKILDVCTCLIRFQIELYNKQRRILEYLKNLSYFLQCHQVNLIE